MASPEQIKRDVAMIHKLTANYGRKPDSIQITVLVDSDKGVPSEDDLRRYHDAGVIPFSQKMGSDSAAGKALEQLQRFAPLVERARGL